MEQIFIYLEKETGVENLSSMAWTEVVNNVILPKLAGRAEYRNRIYPEFMKFLALYADTVCRKDNYLGEILLEIAMQRISNGAVLHEDDTTPTFKALPEAYREYGSQNYHLGGEPGLMGKEEYAFIMQALPVCLQHDNTRSHALAIAFGILKHLTPEGKVADDYMFGTLSFKPDGKALYEAALSWVISYALWDELFRHFAQPTQWQKHKKWLKQEIKCGNLTWKNFFKAIEDPKSGIFKRWRTRARIKKEIMSA